MTTLYQVEAQLRRIGCNFRFWGRPEIRELPNILLPGEVIAGCVNGFYSGGGALLVVTDQRLLLIDRKLLFFSVEDLRFDMIVEIDYDARLLGSTAHIITPTREMRFSSWNQQRLRTIVSKTQEKVLALRQQMLMPQQFAPARLLDPRVTASRMGGVALRSGIRSRYMLARNPYRQTPLFTR